MDARATLVEASLQAVADRIGDPTPRVYARLFELAPEVAPLFAADATGTVRGEMLHRVLDAVLDLVGDAHWAPGLFASEALNHRGLGVAPGRFGTFLAALVDTLRDAAGDAWSDATEAAWRSVRDEVDRIVAAAER